MTYQQHVLDEHLEAYVMRQLQEEETDVLEDHLLLCHHCQQRFSETQQRILAMRTAAKKLRGEEKRSSPRQSALGHFFSSLVVSRPVWAAAAAMAVAMIVVAPRLHQSPVSFDDVNLTVMRGGEAAFDAEHGRRLRLRLDVRDLEVSADLQVAIVSAEGKPVFSSTRIERPDTDSLVVSIDRTLDAGQHWVRVVRPPDQILREYSLRLR